MSEWIEVSVKNSYVEIEDRWQVYYNPNTGEYKVAIFHEDNHFLDEIIFDGVNNNESKWINHIIKRI